MVINHEIVFQKSLKTGIRIYIKKVGGRKVEIETEIGFFVKGEIDDN